MQKEIAKRAKKDSTARAGRTFNDFVKFIEDNPNLLVVEMDTVHVRRSGKVMFRNC